MLPNNIKINTMETNSHLLLLHPFPAYLFLKDKSDTNDTTQI